MFSNPFHIHGMQLRHELSSIDFPSLSSTTAISFFTLTLITNILIGLEYCLYNQVERAVLLVFLIGTPALIGVLYLHRQLVGETHIKSLEYVVVVASVAGLVGVFDIKTKIVETERNAAEYDLAWTDKSVNSSELSLREFERTEPWQRLGQNCSRLTSRFPTSEEEKDIRLTPTSAITGEQIEIRNVCDRSERLRRDLATHVRLHGEARFRLARARDALEIARTSDNGLSPIVEMMGYVMISIGIITQLAKTTAEVCKWYKLKPTLQPTVAAPR